MRFLIIYRFFPSLFLLSTCLCFLPVACRHVPDANDLFAELKAGEAHLVIQLNDQAFYPDDSRFKGEVTVAPDRFRLNITDQHESNVIITLDTQGLYDKKPVQRSIDIQNQVAGSVLIGRIQDKVKRTGEGILMTEGTLTIEALNEERIVIRLKGKGGNFNTIQNPATYRPLEGLLVYRRPPINVPDTDVPADQKKTLLYP